MDPRKSFYTTRVVNTDPSYNDLKLAEAALNNTAKLIRKPKKLDSFKFQNKVQNFFNLRNEEALRTPRAPTGRVNKLLFSKYKSPQEEPKLTLMNNRNLKIQSFKPPLEVT